MTDEQKEMLRLFAEWLKTIPQKNITEKEDCFLIHKTIPEEIRKLTGTVYAAGILIIYKTKRENGFFGQRKTTEASGVLERHLAK